MKKILFIVFYINLVFGQAAVTSQYSGTGHNEWTIGRGGRFPVIPLDTLYKNVDSLNFYHNSPFVWDSSDANEGGTTYGLLRPTNTLRIDEISSADFVSGFAGSGFKIGKDSLNKYTAEFDNAFIRNSLIAYEFIVNQIGVENGPVLFSNYGVVESIDGNDITLEDPNNINACAFAVDDIIKTQVWDVDGTTIIRNVEALVTAVSGNTITVSYYTGTFEEGDAIGRIGNESNVNRQASIYANPLGSNAPYIDFIDGVDTVTAWGGYAKTKVRIGDQSGIVSTEYGALSGHGMWARDNVYLENGFLSVSDSGYMRGGKTNYADNTAGFFLGFDTTGVGGQRFNIGDANFYLKWDGDTLRVKGVIELVDSSGFFVIGGNDLDDITDGTTYSRVKTTALSAGNILLSETIGGLTDISGDLDDISDGSTYGRILKTDISAGHIRLSTVEGDLDSLADGSTYGRVKLTDLSSGRIEIQSESGKTIIDGGVFKTDSLFAQEITATGTITGGTIQTDTSGQRVVINESDDNSITFYNSSGVDAGSISGFVYDSNPYIQINGNAYIGTNDIWGIGDNSKLRFDSGSSPDWWTEYGLDGFELQNIYVTSKYHFRISDYDTDFSHKLEWGVVSGYDVNLYRGDDDELKTDDSFYSLGEVQADDGLSVTNKFIVNASGQITEVNNTTASGNSDKVLMSDGTSFTPTSITADKIADGSVSDTEFEYLDGVTNPIAMNGVNGTVFSASSTSVSVAGLSLARFTYTGGSWALTNLTNGVDGQEVTLLNEGSTSLTLTESGSNFRMAGNFTAGQYDTITFKKYGSYWYEVSRSDN